MPSKVELVCIDPAKVQFVWSKISQCIRRAMERGDLGTFKEVEDAVLSQRALLWMAVADPKILCACVTQLVETERSKVCMILAAGGFNMQSWLPLIRGLENYARDEHCDCVRLMGRKGWARVLKNYNASRVILERRL